MRVTSKAKILAVVFGLLLTLGCQNDSKVQEYVEADMAGPRQQSALVPESAELPKTRWIADTAHSVVTFNVQHFGVVDLIGFFNDFDIVMHSEAEDWSDTVIEARVRTQSATMPNKRMEGHIKQEGFFDSKAFPEMLYRSTSFKHLGGNSYQLAGALTIRDITHNVPMNVRFNGFAYPDERRNPGFKASGYIVQQDWGWENTDRLHSGKLILGDTIHFEAHLRFDRVEE